MTQRKEKRATNPSPPKRERNWIGRDVMSDFRKRRFSLRPSLPLLLFAVLAALALVILRSDVLRIRYALSDAMAKEQTLLAQQRDYTVQVRRLRDPGQLVRLAQDQGFARPERIIYLKDSPPQPEGEAMP